MSAVYRTDDGFSFDLTDFERAAKRLINERAPRDMERFWRTQAKGILREIIKGTSPGGRAVHGVAAKRRGEMALIADVHKVVEGAPKRAVEETDVNAVVDAARNSRGRTKRRDRKIKVPRGAIRPAIAERKKRVGKLADGWGAAAKELGVRVPAWQSRHRSPGRIDITATRDGVRIVATNQVRYASEHGSLEKTIQRAIDAQADKLDRQAQFLIEQAAKQSGFN